MPRRLSILLILANVLGWGLLGLDLAQSYGSTRTYATRVVYQSYDYSRKPPRLQIGTLAADGLIDTSKPLVVGRSYWLTVRNYTWPNQQRRYVVKAEAVE